MKNPQRFSHKFYISDPVKVTNTGSYHHYCQQINNIKILQSMILILVILFGVEVVWFLVKYYLVSQQVLILINIFQILLSYFLSRCCDKDNVLLTQIFFEKSLMSSPNVPLCPLGVTKQTHFKIINGGISLILVAQFTWFQYCVLKLFQNFDICSNWNSQWWSLNEYKTCSRPR